MQGPQDTEPRRIGYVSASHTKADRLRDPCTLSALSFRIPSLKPVLHQSIYTWATYGPAGSSRVQWRGAPSVFSSQAHSFSLVRDCKHATAARLTDAGEELAGCWGKSYVRDHAPLLEPTLAPLCHVSLQLVPKQKTSTSLAAGWWAEPRSLETMPGACGRAPQPTVWHGTAARGSALDPGDHLAALRSPAATKQCICGALAGPFMMAAATTAISTRVNPSGELPLRRNSEVRQPTPNRHC